MSEIATSPKEMQAPLPVETAEKPAEKSGDKTEIASNAGDEKKSKKRDEVAIPQPEDFEERKKSSWKPEPLPDGTNIASSFADIRAKHSEACAQEIKEFAGKHCATGMWPTHNLTVVFGDAQDKRKKAEKLKQDAIDAANAANEKKEERAQAKTRELASLKTALSLAFTDALNDPKLEGKTIIEKSPFAVEAVEAVCLEWGPKINSWIGAAFQEACGLVKGYGPTTEKINEILAKPEAQPKAKEESGGKRKVREEDVGGSSSADASPAGVEAAEPGKKKKKDEYRISRKSAKGSGPKPGEVPAAMKQHMQRSEA